MSKASNPYQVIIEIVPFGSTSQEASGNIRRFAVETTVTMQQALDGLDIMAKTIRDAMREGLWR